MLDGQGGSQITTKETFEMNKEVTKQHQEAELDELLFLNVVLHDCHVFLQKWNVLIPNRVETMEDAFVAITELEQNMRARRDWIVKRVGVDVVPF